MTILASRDVSVAKKEARISGRSSHQKEAKIPVGRLSGANRNGEQRFGNPSQTDYGGSAIVPSRKHVMKSVTVRPRPPRVLVVEDDTLMRSFLREALEEDEEARVVEAATGEQAIGILEAPRWVLDLVLLDHILPGRSGLEILKITRRRWPWIPVIIITAFGSEDLAAQALRAGASDYLRKPVGLDTLKETVRALTTVRGERMGRRVTAAVEQHEETRTVRPNIGRALDFMREHFAEDVTLDDVARVAALSKFHFCRLFHHETGVMFHECLHRLRVARAKALLANRHLTVSEVAYTVGFNDLSHFDRTFRRIVGRSPTEYRTSLQCA